MATNNRSEYRGPTLSDELRETVQRYNARLQGDLSRSDLSDIRIPSRNEHKLWDALQYPHERDLDFDAYLVRYARQGAASGLVDKPVTDTWQTFPHILDEEGDPTDRTDSRTEFESDVKTFFDNARQVDLRTSPQRRISTVDTLATLGEYALIVVGLADDKSISEPIEEDAVAEMGLEGVTYLEAVPQDRIEMELVQDMDDRRYGRPDQYLIDNDGMDTRVHASRCIHVTEGEFIDPLRGMPFYKPIINRLVDIDKILGASAEGYWRAGYPGYVIRPPEDVTGQVMQFSDSSGLAREISEWTEDFKKTIATTGEVDMLGSNITSPAQHMEEQWKAIAAAKDFPQSVLVGNETGERATTEDSKMWAQKIASRRNSYAGPAILRPLIELLWFAGAISDPEGGEFRITWQPLDEPDEAERANIAASKSKAIASLSGGNPLLIATPGELRRHVMNWKPERGSEAPDVDESDLDVDPAAQLDEQDPEIAAMVERSAQGSAGDPTNTDTVTEDQTRENARIAAVEDFHFNRRVNAKEDELDEVYSEFTNAVNMSYSQLEKWSEHPCSDTASVDKQAVVKRNLRLLNKNKSEWTTKDIGDAKRTVSFIERMKGAMGENPSDGKTVEEDGQEYDCPSKAVVSLRNWAHDPLSRYNSLQERWNAEFSENDLVSWGDGDRSKGFVFAVMREDFDFEGSSYEASDDNPAYLVARPSGTPGVYRESDLSSIESLTDEDPDPAELDGRQNGVYKDVANAHSPSFGGVDRANAGFRRLPEGWTQLTVMEVYLKVGPKFDSCVREMRADIRDPQGFCAALIDEALGTTSWRGDGF